MNFGDISAADMVAVEYMHKIPKPEYIEQEREFEVEGLVKCPDCGLCFDNRDGYDRSFHKRYHKLVHDGVMRGVIFNGVDKAKSAYEVAYQILWESDNTYVQINAAEALVRAKWTLYYLLNIQWGCAGTMMSMPAYKYEFIKINKDYFPDEIYVIMLGRAREELKKEREEKKVASSQTSTVNLIPISELACKKEISNEEFKSIYQIGKEA